MIEQNKEAQKKKKKKQQQLYKMYRKSKILEMKIPATS